jgi:hypothetical protein
MRGKAISDEVRVAIAADLAAGATRKEVAAKYGVSEGSVGRYSPLAKRGAVYRGKLASLNQLGDRYLSLLDKNFTALEALADHIAKHPGAYAGDAQGVAILYGVVFDKTGKLAGAALAGAGLLPGVVSGPAGDHTAAAGPVDPDDQDAP